ncbi:MAG TPA: YetF domain-containing protein [Mycobacteriales bacterium]|nr:YetF domain-containing protein [Mycobacteriales bacterium]
MDLVLRAAVVYVVLMIYTRILGRRELSSMQPFDVILLVVIGDLIQQGVTQNDDSVTGVVIVLATLGLGVVTSSYLSFRFRRLRPFLQGEPIVLVEHGRMIEQNMRRERLTVDDLYEQARKSSIASLDEVAWAVLETNGEISFIKES